METPGIHGAEPPPPILHAGQPTIRPKPQANPHDDGSDISDAPRRAAQVRALVARVRAMPEGRAAAVEAARAALRSGELDSQAAIAAAVRAIRLGR